MTPQQVQTFLPYLIALPFIGLVIWRNARERRLRVEMLWIFPAILLALGGLALAHLGTPSPLLMAVFALSAVAGGVLGWMRGRMMRIMIDPESHRLTVQASPLAMLFILALFAVRFGARMVLGENAPAWHLNLEQISDVFLVFVIMLLVVMRVEMWLRASRMLSEARAARAAARAG